MKNKNIIHQLTSQSPSQMSSYVIESKDGGVIVIDGGTYKDAEYLINYIKNISGETKPVIRAWILTHTHNDHTGAIIEACKNEKYKDAFILENLYYNFPPDEIIARCDNGELVTSAEFEAVRSAYGSVTRPLNENDVLDFGEIKFKILYAADFKITENFTNNTSTVLKMYADGQTMLFLGDLGIEGGEILLKNKKDEINCDFVAMAHHGQQGVSFEVYKAVAPKVCFWDTPLWLWNNDAGGGYNTHIWQTVVVRGWMEILGVKYHYISKDGTNAVELPFKF